MELLTDRFSPALTFLVTWERVDPQLFLTYHTNAAGASHHGCVLLTTFDPYCWCLSRSAVVALVTVPIQASWNILVAEAPAIHHPMMNDDSLLVSSCLSTCLEEYAHVSPPCSFLHCQWATTLMHLASPRCAECCSLPWTALSWTDTSTGLWLQVSSRKLNFSYLTCRLLDHMSHHHDM